MELTVFLAQELRIIEELLALLRGECVCQADNIKKKPAAIWGGIFGQKY